MGLCLLPNGVPVDIVNRIDARLIEAMRRSGPATRTNAGDRHRAACEPAAIRRDRPPIRCRNCRTRARPGSVVDWRNHGEPFRCTSRTRRVGASIARTR